MKPRNPVLLSRDQGHRLKRQDVLAVDALYMITYQGQPITIAVIDENILHSATPRYQNTVYSQEKSAQNAAVKLNTAFDTDAFVVRRVKFAD
jgi:hypothetical protein